jgi:hypothetical protein
MDERLIMLRHTLWMFDFPRLFPQFKTNKILRFFLRVLLANRGNCFPKIPYPLPSTVYNFYFIYWHKRLSHFALKNSTVFNFVKLAQDWTTFAPGMFAFTVPKVEVPETVRIFEICIWEMGVFFWEILCRWRKGNHDEAKWFHIFLPNK